MVVCGMVLKPILKGIKIRGENTRWAPDPVGLQPQLPNYFRPFIEDRTPCIQ